MTTISTPVPSTVLIGNKGDELLFAQIFIRPKQNLTRPAVGVYLWEGDEDEWQVSLAMAGTSRGDASFPAGLDHRMSPPMSLPAAKALMRQYVAEVETAVRAEWKAAVRDEWE